LSESFIRLAKSDGLNSRIMLVSVVASSKNCGVVIVERSTLKSVFSDLAGDKIANMDSSFSCVDPDEAGHYT
jgi:hypothetical protein